MATGADVRDILELTGGENDGPISKKDLINSDKVRDNHNIQLCLSQYSCTFSSFYPVFKALHRLWDSNTKPCHSHRKYVILCNTSVYKRFL